MKLAVFVLAIACANSAYADITLGNIRVTYPDGDINLLMTEDTLIINGCIVETSTGEFVGDCQGIKIEVLEGKVSPEPINGACSPYIGNTKGSVTINMTGSCNE